MDKAVPFKPHLPKENAAHWRVEGIVEENASLFMVSEQHYKRRGLAFCWTRQFICTAREGRIHSNSRNKKHMTLMNWLRIQKTCK